MAILPEAELNNRLINLVEEWQKAEDDSIANCEKMLNATDNALIEAIIDIVKSDSTRHKEILTMIGQAIDGDVTLNREEVKNISGLIAEHLEIERNAVGLALKEFEKSDNIAVRQLLSYLLEDEKKHFMLLTQLSDFELLNPQD